MTTMLSKKTIHLLSRSLKLTTNIQRQRRTSVVSQITRHGHRLSFFSSSSSSTTSSSSSNISFDPATSSSHHDSSYYDSLMIRSLPWQFLRSADSSNYDPITHQRCDVPFDIHNGKVENVNTTNDDNKKNNDVSIQFVSSTKDYYDIVWSDGLRSQYSKSFIEKQIYHWKRMTTTTTTTSDRSNRYGRVFWNNLKEDDIRESDTMSIKFDELLFGDSGMNRALTALYRYGILLIKGTPVVDNDGSGGGNEAAVAALGAAVSGGQVKNELNSSLVANYRHKNNVTVLPQGTDGPLRTLYGTVWSTTTAGQAEGASIADSAYGNEGLPLHTDMTYMRDPPGLQIFTMVQRAMKGGESIFGDGFAIAQRLKEINPKAFDILSQTIRTYRCLDEETGWNLQASGPIIAVDNNKNDRIVAIRHNDLDRLPDLPPRDVIQSNTVDTFYKELKDAHQAWDELISSDEFRLIIQLQPGETMVVANQRCFHGRYSFQASAEAPRSVMGCYISQDDLYSRFRMEGFDV